MAESCLITAFNAPGNKQSGRKIKISKETRKLVVNKSLLFFIDKLRANEPDHVFDYRTIVKKRKTKMLCLECDKRY